MYLYLYRTYLPQPEPEFYAATSPARVRHYYLISIHYLTSSLGYYMYLLFLSHTLHTHILARSCIYTFVDSYLSKA